MKTKHLNHIFFILFAISFFLFTSCESKSSKTTNSQSNQDNATYVYVCNSRNSVAFHCDVNCSGLTRCSHDIVYISVSEAKNRGLRKCKKCY